MARDQFSDVILLTKEIDTPTGNEIVLIPAEDVRVHVFAPATTTLQTIFEARTGATTQPNPFLTTATGGVEFWAEYGDYDIFYEETLVPARISDVTFGWNAVPGGDGAIPTNKIADDAITEAKILDAILTKLYDVGDLRPVAYASTAGSEPTGWLFCDGRAVSRTTFSALFTKLGGVSNPYGIGDGSTTFNLPDFRGRALLAPDGGAGRVTANNTRGLGAGSQAIPLHTHGMDAAGSHGHNIFGGGHEHFYTYSGNFGGNAFFQGGAVAHGFTFDSIAGTAGGGGHSHTTDAQGSHAHTVHNAGTGLNNLPPYQIAGGWLVKT